MIGATPATDAVRVALALALGGEVPSPTRADWRRVHAAARAERLVALAWLRSGEQIRRYAPPEVVARWRAECVAAAELADRQLKALRDIAGAAERERPLVLKGLPLADRLYGDASARVCCDIDLFVPEGERPRAHEQLTRLGWEHWHGTPPFDASYRRTDADGALFLEVHSLLSSEAMAHCQVAADSETPWSRGGLVLRTLDGPVLPVYLAVNLANHGTPPLLSFFDLATVWAGLDEADREAAYRLAARSRLARCLRWALARADALPAAARGELGALRMLGFHRDRRTSMHALLRLIWLSDRPVDAARILATWAWPRSLRHSRGAVVPFWGRRMRRSFAGRFTYIRAYPADARAQR